MVKKGKGEKKRSSPEYKKTGIPPSKSRDLYTTTENEA